MRAAPRTATGRAKLAALMIIRAYETSNASLLCSREFNVLFEGEDAAAVDAALCELMHTMPGLAYAVRCRVLKACVAPAWRDAARGAQYLREQPHLFDEARPAQGGLWD